MKLKNKIFIFTLLLSTLFIGTGQALAAEPTPIVDESAYISLDYYGSIKKTEVVKTITLNGNNNYVDYGNYLNVKNLTTLDKPEIRDGEIIWKFDQNIPKTFYYQITPKDNYLELPWKIDVGYKLNGVPIKAQDLAGKAGLIDIDVDVEPNSKAEQYYQDNFVLAVGTMVDSDKHYSFSAPGSQFQTLGSFQLAFFMALPKQSQSFHFEIGTDSFESNGLFLAMMPATLDQLKSVKEIKAHKASIEGASRAIDGLMDDIFAIMGGMKGGLQTTTEGLNELNNARQKVMDHSEENMENLNQSKDSLGAVKSRIDSLNTIVANSSYSATASAMGVNDGLSETSDLMDKLHRSLGSAISTLDDSGDSLNTGMEKSISGMSQLTHDLGLALDKTNDLQKNKNTISNIVKDEWNRLDKDLGILDIDIDAKKLSLTSKKNQAPRSLQIILRTEEITLDDDNNIDNEQQEIIDDLGFFGRLKFVFKTMGETIKMVF